LQFIGATYNNSEVSQVVHANSNNRNGFSIAGLLRSASADIILNFGYGNTVVSSIKYTISKDDEPIISIPRSWAALNIGMLEMQPKKNKKAITEIGKEYSIVTSNTSLLVLDRVEDYVQYDIIPPADLRAAFDSLVTIKKKISSEEKERPIEQSLLVMKEIKKWYLKDFPKKMQQFSADKKTETNSRTAFGLASATREVEASANLSYGYSVADSTVPQRMNAPIQAAPQSDAGSYNVGNISLSPDTAGLESVVVTGISNNTQRRELRSVTLTNGQPGSNANVTIRGSRSTSSAANPLLIVDGIPFNGRMDDIPAGDIVSTEILRDDAASALYGSRAAGGVMIITTRNGDRNKADSLADVIDSTVDANSNLGNIEMNEWKPNADYLKVIQKSLAADYYQLTLTQNAK